MVKLTEVAEHNIQNMIKNNLKSKKNKRTKNLEVLVDLTEKEEADDMQALDDIKKEINTQLCGGIIIDKDHDKCTDGRESVTYKEILKMSNSKKKSEPKTMQELLNNINSVDNEHYKLNKTSVLYLQLVNFKLNR